MTKGYNCEPCGFHGRCKGDIERHKMTNKHNRLTRTIACDQCPKKFENQLNLSRHKRHCKPTINETRKIKKIQTEPSIKTITIIKKTIPKENKNTKYLEMKNKLRDIELKLENKELELQKTQQDNEYFKRLLEHDLNKQTSALNYIVKYFIDSPDVYPFTNFLDYVKDEEGLADELVYYYKHKKLAEFIGDMIIKEYVRENPKDQSIWNTDYHRFKCIIKQSINSVSQWNIDRGNINFAELLIKPILVYIKEVLREQLKIESIGINGGCIGYDFHGGIEKMSIITKIIADIDDKILTRDIIRYCSSKFYFDRNILGE